MLNPKPTSSLHTKRYLTRISKKLLLADLAIVAAQLGKRCISHGDYRRHGRFSLGVYRIRFKTWEQALQHGAKVTGCTVHFVDEGMDSGPIIVQRTVPVLPGDTPATLHARIQEQEHLAYPEALQLLAQGRLRIEGRRVEILPG